jgi:signal transduction histidine kinase
MRLLAEEQWVSLIIQDDGCGFETQTVSQSLGSGSGHFGLTGMAERVKLLGGSMYIQSELGTGTSIRVSVPY